MSGSVTSEVKMMDRKKGKLKDSSKFEYLMNKSRRAYEKVNGVQAKIVNKTM